MYTSQGDTPDNNFIIDNYIEVNEYQINKDDIIYNILLGKKNNSIIIRSLQFFYEQKLNEFTFDDYKFNTINELYKFFNDFFEQNRVKIDRIDNDKEKLELSFSSEEKSFQLFLNYYKHNTIHIINYLWNKNMKLKKDLNKINEQINQIKDEYELLRNKNIELGVENNKIKEENLNLKKEINQIKEELNIFKQENNKIKQDIKNIMENYKRILEEVNSIKKIKLSINKNISQTTFSILIRDHPWIQNITPLNNCSPKDKVSDIMERYKKEINDNNLKFYFIYNAKRLDEKNTMAEAGIRYGNIFTLEVERIKG